MKIVIRCTTKTYEPIKNRQDVHKDDDTYWVYYGSINDQHPMIICDLNEAYGFIERLSRLYKTVQYTAEEYKE